MDLAQSILNFWKIANSPTVGVLECGGKGANFNAVVLFIAANVGHLVALLSIVFLSQNVTCIEFSLILIL